MTETKKILLKKGVNIINPDSVEIGHDVHPDRISPDGVIIYPGTRISGEKTLILQNSKLGNEAPVTVDNCYIGPDVKLGGGDFRDCVFLNHSSVGSCAHVREGCIFEEHAGAAHSVGVKQTILFPYVTLGSLINFCDCMMAGGTDKKNHSEVGSSYIHFNFTPQQDKATPSLIGDVPRGVMLDQPPIFLGGQGGLVGPCRLTFGITIAAGTICRKDELRPNRLIFGGEGKGGNISYTPGMYRNVKRNVINNLIYIGNLYALSQWYAHVRSLFVSDNFPAALYDGLGRVLKMGIDERIKRLDEFIGKLDDSSRRYQAEKKELVSKQNQIKELIQSVHDLPVSIDAKEQFIGAVEKEKQKNGNNYIGIIKGLAPDAKEAGTIWLQHIVDRQVNEVTAILPSIRPNS